MRRGQRKDNPNVCVGVGAGDPRLAVHELAGGRRLERHLILNPTEDTLLVWSSLGTQEVYPWTPQLKVGIPLK